MKTTARLALALLLVAFTGCATPRPASDDPAVYRPAHPIHYPAPR